MEELKQLRKKINQVDEKILHAINDRVQICRSIGETKRRMHLPVKDPDREEEVLAHVRKAAKNLELDPLQVTAIYREIVNMCCSVQE
jgi:chorismate mutase